MASVTAAPATSQLGKTARKDAWWVGPFLTFLGLMAFVVYATHTGLQGNYFEIREDAGRFAGKTVAPYLSPMYSPLLYDNSSPHAWFKKQNPSWWPVWMPFSAALLILPFPAIFRFTCYYYRKAYYRSIWLDPPACVVGEPRTSYWGENHWPLLLQNIHRYTLYIAVLFLIILWWDAIYSLWWPTNRKGELLDGGCHQVGLGVGTLVMLANVVLLTGFTLGCNSMRHLLGGRINSFACFSCPAGGGSPEQKLSASFKTWKFSTYFNNQHMLWAWLSLFSVGFTDFYIRMCAMGYWSDLRIF